MDNAFHCFQLSTVSSMISFFNVTTFQISYTFGNFLDPLETTQLTLNKMHCLHIAAMQGHTEVVETLVRHGAKKEVTDSSGTTALFHAASHDHKDTVQV